MDRSELAFLLSRVCRDGPSGDHPDTCNSSGMIHVAPMKHSEPSSWQDVPYPANVHVAPAGVRSMAQSHRVAGHTVKCDNVGPSDTLDAFDILRTVRHPRHLKAGP